MLEGPPKHRGIQFEQGGLAHYISRDLNLACRE